MNINNLILKEAQQLHKLGLCPIPVQKRSKKPTILWEKYQDVKPSYDDLSTLFKDPEGNLGIILGSSHSSIDFDIDKSTGLLPPYASGLFDELSSSNPTWTILTGGGGFQLIYKTLPGKPIPRKIKYKPGVDILGKGIAIIPPSIHPSGEPYENLSDPELDEIALFPYDMFPDLFIECNNESSYVSSNGNSQKISEGERNSRLTSIAGTLFKALPHKKDLCKNAIRGINLIECIPPLPEKEIETLIESINKYHLDDTKINKTFTPISVDELLRKEFEADSWLVEGLIPKNGITVISGNPASFKTWLILLLAKHIAEGEALFGRFRI